MNICHCVCYIFLFILFPLLCGVDVRWHSPPSSTVVHITGRQSLLFDVILYFVQPSSLRPSSIPCSLYFHFHRPPSYAVLLSSHHMPIPLQPLFLDFRCDFPHFPSFFHLLSSFVTPHIHRSIRISAISNFFSCAFFDAHVSASSLPMSLPRTVPVTYFTLFTYITACITDAGILRETCRRHRVRSTKRGLG